MEEPVQRSGVEDRKSAESLSLAEGRPGLTWSQLQGVPLNPK